MAATKVRRVLGLAAVAMGTTLIWSASGTAAPSVVTARLGLAGIEVSSHLRGAGSLRLRAGDTVAFFAGTVPGLDRSDLGDMLGLRVSMDASRVPGGSHDVRLSSRKSYRLTVQRPGTFTVKWTVAFPVGHGRKYSTLVTHEYSGSLIVGAALPGHSSRVVTTRGDAAAVASVQSPDAAAPGSARPVSPARAPTNRSTSPDPAGTIVLPSDKGTAHHPNPGAITPLPSSAPADTFIFTAFVGFSVLGLLWLLWIASVKPILGR